MNQTAALRPRQPLVRAVLAARGAAVAVAGPIDRLLARLPAPVEERIRQRLGLDLFIVVAVVVVFMRLFAVSPWTPGVLDMHTYWATRGGITYAGSDPYTIGAYLYAPVFAQVLWPIAASVPWPVFAALWTALIAVAVVWLVGRWSFPVLLFSGALALELYLGQIDVFIAVAVLIGFRYPAAYAFPLLTKVAPGIGLLWFAFRREWRALAIAGAATVAVAAVSAWLAPALWHDWYDLLRRSVTDKQVVDGAYVAIPVWARLPFAVGIIFWGARTSRHWTVPVAILLAMPILWINVFTLLIAVIPLRAEAGLTPARAWLLRERLLPLPAGAGVRSRAPKPSTAPQIG
ncbi:MAG TPA: glycosyltransferase 87 family protein [Candidatus Limnocylindrales bacterium]|nr:glycosyltransferase 87 family protein [Candidatus Limnocylindrales bacterium]